jgi:hypothetical protein
MMIRLGSDHIDRQYGLSIFTAKSYLVDLIQLNGHKKDGETMCAAFERMIDNTERKYGCIIVLFCCDNDGGSQRGRKNLGIKGPWLLIVPCCAHQVRPSSPYDLEENWNKEKFEAQHV